MDGLKTYPILRLAIPLAAGVLFAGHFPGFPLMGTVFVLALLFVALGGLLFLRRFDSRWMFGAGVMLFMFGAGCLLTGLKWRQVKVEWPVEKRRYEGIVQEPPTEKRRSVQCRVRTNGKELLLYLAKDSLAGTVEMGDILQFYTTVHSPENRGDSITFDYATYLYRKGISGTAYVPSGSWQKQDVPRRLTLKQKALFVREKVVDTYRTWGLSDEQLPVLSALTIGYKADLEKEQREWYAVAGISHVLALSGLHVGIVWMLLGWVLRPLDRFSCLRWPKWAFSTLFLWAFAFVSGLEASVVRAVIMCMLMELGRMSGGRTLSMNTLAIAAFFMLLYNPFYLFDVGFQLSFVAVISILLFYPLFNRLVSVRSRLFGWGWNTVSVSVAAQLGTAPLVMYYFSNFSVYFLLANIVAALLVPLIVGLGFLAMALTPFPALAQGVAFGLGKIIGILNLTAREISGWPYARLGWADIPVVEVGMAYLLLWAVWGYWKKPARRRLIVLLSCVVLFLAVHLMAGR